MKLLPTLNLTERARVLTRIFRTYTGIISGNIRPPSGRSDLVAVNPDEVGQRGWMCHSSGGETSRLKLRPLPLPDPAEAIARRDSQRQKFHPVWLGTQVMPYSIVLNARKTPRDIYDD